MKNKKKLIIITSILAIGIPLLAIGTQSILKKVREDYYKNQREQIEAQKAKEKAEREQKLAQEKAEKERQLQLEKAEREQKLANERKEPVTGQNSQKSKKGKEKVKISNATTTFTPTANVVEKRELTPEEIKRAKKALKEARASYFSGNKAAKLPKSSKSTDKIIIKSDRKGNVEAIRHTKEQSDKAQKILKEIRESYYKDKKK
nr:hypothetical protein [uncultured Leptotrichia sp.]